MQNYVMHLIKDRAWTPKYYNPDSGLVITGKHVGRFYGVMLARA